MSASQRPSMTVAEIAALVGGEVRGDAERRVFGINRIEMAGPSEATFLSSPKYVKFLGVSTAGCVIVSKDLLDEDAYEQPTDKSLVVAEDAYRAFVKVMQAFFPPTVMEPGVRSASATIHPTASVHATASIGPGCVIERDCVIEAGAQLFANVVLYPGCTIGEDTMLHANVTLCTGTTVGKRGILHSGVVVGADGFGFFENPDGSFEKIPQVGTVEIGDDVEIGANTCIDRAAVGHTTIGNGVKLDNLIHIAHGVTLGENTAIAAQTGISGSTALGARNRIAGQVGIVGHISTTDDVIVEAQSGLMRSVTESGAYFGSPAKEHRQALRMEAALRRLPDLLREFEELKRTIASNDAKDS